MQGVSEAQQIVFLEKKLEEQLEAARAKVAERANKRRDDIKRAIERKEVARKAQLDLIAKANEAVAQIDNDIEILTDQPLVVTSRTYNQSTAGTFGQSYDGFRREQGVAAGGTVCASTL